MIDGRLGRPILKNPTNRIRNAQVQRETESGGVGVWGGGGGGGTAGEERGDKVEDGLVLQVLHEVLLVEPQAREERLLRDAGPELPRGVRRV